MKNILSIVVALLVFSSCEEKPHAAVDYNLRFCILNNSGVQVVIVPKSYYSSIPDSLILQHQMKYEWGVFFGPFLLDKETDLLRVYFNENVKVSYSGDINDIDHDPRNPGNYIYELLGDGRGMCTYTFTAEDYQRAIEQNKDKK